MTPRALFHPARLARRPVLSTQSDERLVDLVRAGSDPAFEAIVERYRRALMRYVSRLLPPERAEDVVQQAFVKAYEAMHRSAAELHLRPWLYRIAHNGALNALRDRGLTHAELSDAIDGVERPDQAFERAAGLRDLVVAVNALPERQRNAILLREMEGRSYEEIALALGVTDGAVRQLLNRARNSLRAAAASIVPMPLVERVASAGSSDPIAGRVSELVGMGGSALAIKLCATALVTGAVVGGAAIAPGDRQDGRRDVGSGAQVADDTSSGSKEEGSGAGDDELAGDDRGPAGLSGRDGGRAGGDARSGGGSGRAGTGGSRDAGSGSGTGGRGTGDRGGTGDGGTGDRDGGGSGSGHDDGSGGHDGGGDHSGPGGGGDSSGPASGEPATDPRLDGPDDHSGPGGGGGDVLTQPAEVGDDHSEPDGGGDPSSDGSGSGSSSSGDDGGDLTGYSAG
jgi:RNA polymerase sigma factor (sigma-70 family)